MLVTHRAGRGLTIFWLLLFLCASSAVAQQRDGGLRGQIVDQLGAVLAGATVTAVSETGAETKATTDSDGVYTFNGLAPGTYTVRAAAPGFAPYEKTGVVVKAGERESLNISMGIELQEDVTVAPNVNTPSLDPEGGANALVLRGSDLDALSDDPDQLAEDLRSIAGATGPGGAQFFVDGFSGGRLPPKASIREVRINQNPFSSEQDTLGFGRIDIFTKPGTDKLHGQGFITFSDESLNARNPFAPVRAPFQSRQYGGNVSGSLSKTSSFFFDVEKRDIDENATVSATVLDANFLPVSFPLALATPQRRTNFSGRMDFQFGRNHTLVARYSLLHVNLENEGVGGFSLESQATDSTQTDHTLQLTETAVLSATMINETRFQYVHRTLDRTGDDSLPTIDVRGAFVGGGARLGLVENTSDRFELNNITTWARETHSVKFGGRLRYNRIDDATDSGFNGTYVFDSLAQYRDVVTGVPGARPAQFVRSAGDPLSRVNQVDVGVFLQDDWRVRPDFTFSYGVRFEGQNNINDHFNFAPRLGFAWAPKVAPDTRRPTTVLRGGVGVFYYRFGEDLSLQADRFNGLTQQQVIVNSPAFYPSIPLVSSLIGASPRTNWRVADDLRAPYVIDAALSVEQQLPLRTTLGVTYIYEAGRHLLRSRALNAPLPGTFIPGVPGSGVRPLGTTDNVFQFESSGTSRGQVLYFNLRSQVSRRLQIFSLARLFKDESDTDGAFDFPANSYDVSNEYGSSAGSTGPSMFLGANITLPFGFSLSPLIRASSGTRFNITTGRDTNGDSVFTERPAFATDPSKPGVVVTRFGTFDPNPAPGQALIPRNYGKNPTLFFVNLRVAKTIAFGKAAAAAGPAAPGGGQIVLIGPGGERISGGGRGPSAGPGGKPYSLTFSVAAQNIFNRANFGPLVGNLSSPNFGRANGVATSPRRLDLQVRFSF